jgi:hypothetical protein
MKTNHAVVLCSVKSLPTPHLAHASHVRAPSARWLMTAKCAATRTLLCAVTSHLFTPELIVVSAVRLSGCVTQDAVTQVQSV